VSGSYETAFEASILRPESFWGEAGAAVDWTRRWDKVLDRSASPVPRWFAGGTLNTCCNAVDRHVLAGRGDATAVIYDSPITGATGQLVQGRDHDWDELVKQAVPAACVSVEATAPLDILYTSGTTGGSEASPRLPGARWGLSPLRTLGAGRPCTTHRRSEGE